MGLKQVSYKRKLEVTTKFVICQDTPRLLLQRAL